MADDNAVADEQTGGMIALVPDNPAALAVAGGEPADELHCTLVFLGDDAGSWSPRRVDALRSLVAGIATRIAPIDAAVFSHAVWNAAGADNPQGEPTTPTLVLQLRATPELTNAFGQAHEGARYVMSVDYPQQWVPWTPHIAVAYDSKDTGQLDTSVGAAVRFSTIRLAVGSDVYDYPITGGATRGPDPREGMPELTDTTGKEGQMATKKPTAPKPAPPKAKVAPAKSNQAPEVTDTGDGELAAFWPCLLVEGLRTSDRRMIKPGAISHRALPLSVLAQTRNPGADGGHSGAEVIGSITELVRRPGPEVTSRETGEPFPDGTYVWQATGTLDPDTDGGRLAAKGHLRGNSADLSEIDYEEEFADGDDQPTTTLTAGKIAATTLCAVPAFADAYVAIGEHTDPVDSEGLAASGAPEAELLDMKPVPAYRGEELGDECVPCREALEHSNDRHDGDGWTEVDGQFAPTAEKRRRAYARGLAIKGDKADGSDATFPVEGQADLDKAHKLKGTGDVHPDTVDKHLRKVARKLNLKLPGAVAAAGAPELPELADFQDPGFTEATPIRVEGDLISGHIATWGTCHISFPGRCVPPPRSASDYAYFATGAQRVRDGDAVRTVAVGHLTMTTKHAELSDDLNAAARHYDHTGAVAADVAAGEDRHGIWIAGRVRPGLTAAQRHELTASAPSGDWRPVAGRLEMVAVLCVNTPGYPVPRSRVASGEVQALIAAGAVQAATAVAPVTAADLAAFEESVVARIARMLKAAGVETAPDASEHADDPDEFAALAELFQREADLEELGAPFGQGSSVTPTS